MSKSPTPYVTDKTEYKIPENIVTKIEDIAQKFPDKNSAVLPALHLTQDEFGWLPGSAVTQLAKILNTTPNKLYSVITFYTMFNEKPVGRYHIQICRNVSCSLLGSKHIIEHVTHKLQIKPGETTNDKKFTLSLVECLGACGTAPVMMVNDKYFENLTNEKIDNILNSFE